MMSKKNVPELRFPEFSGEWDKRKLNEISDKVREKNKDMKISETLTNSAQFGIVSQRDYFDKDISSLKSLSNYYVVKPDDFVYNPRISKHAPVGPVKRNKLNRLGVMSPLYYVFRTKDVDKEFLEYYFETTKWHKFMYFNGDTGARSDRFSIKDSVFQTMDIPYPEEVEQRKIGNLFKKIDRLIELEEKKLELLEEQKKGYMQKIFSQELRFKDEYGNDYPEWETVSLKDISDKVSDKNKDNIYTETLTNSAEKGIMSQREYFDKDISNAKNINNYYLAQPNDYVYNPRISSFAPVGPIKRNKLGRVGVMSPLYYVFRAKKINLHYLDYYFESTHWHRFMKLNGDSGVRSDRISIKNKDIQRLPVLLPSEKEQHKIGKFFNKLDKLSELQKKKLINLVRRKNGLLQKMLL